MRIFSRITGGFCAVFGFVAAMHASPARAYRTASDLQEFAGHGPVAWRVPSVDFFVVIAQGASAPSIEKSVVETSLSAWESVGCSSLDLGYGGTVATNTLGDGVNTVQFVDSEWASSGRPAGAAGFTDLRYVQQLDGSWSIVEADIVLNADEFTWSSDGTGAERSLRAVLTHELGHALGLLHPCEETETFGVPLCSSSAGFVTTTMFPTYVGTSQESLGDDDVAGMCALYSDVACPSSCSPGSSCSHGACVVVCSGIVCAEGDACIDGACVPECERLACLASGSCSSDDACPPDRACQDGLCLPRGGVSGDPCDSASACLSGHCDGAGRCTTTCAAGCDTGFACAAIDALCHATGAVLGEPCVGGNDCASGLCLRGEALSPRCTRPCGSPFVPCPADYVCDRVSGADVCRPERLARVGRGCSAVPFAHPRDHLRVLVALFVLALLRVVLVRSRIR